MTRSVLARLEAFQREFSAMLRAPLDGSSGTLRANADAYPRGLRDQVRTVGTASVDRLAVYNRQYWFRLFNVLQGSHPLTTALLGAWAFNELAAEYLRAHPPRGHELATVSAGFAVFLVERGGDLKNAVPREAAIEAVQIDAAFHGARTAPISAPLRLSASNAHRLEAGRLIRSPSFSIISESWPLVALRHELPTPLGEHRARLPERHPQDLKTWLIGRSPKGIRAVPLTPVQASLFEHLGMRSLGEALALLEDRHGDAIGADVQRWLAEAMGLGVWTAVESST